MEVFALSGASGTGKSTIALSFAHEKKIPAIIDDGLLIFNGHRIAGTSAKFEKNPITAVKRAVFFDIGHRQEVQAAIAAHFINKILIIGTSDKMVKQIAKNLGLGEIKQIYHIEDIRTSSEIKMAQFIRKTEGKHVIPIPYRQVEQNFFKKLIQKGMKIFTPKKEMIGETTIVHPDFQRGHITIHKNVFKDIVEDVCLRHKDVYECKSIQISMKSVPILKLNIVLHTPLDRSINVVKMTEDLQKELFDVFKKIFHIELYSVNLHIQMASKKMEVP
ncbi:hypothetical protein [Bacillus dakarensis]|uniref:hypothetical protein n=1 Tax=Robertmurraya dakarensis TaxID=1926278 RepID=UPI000980F3B3|nr:hypothetical protein [Bacillus dakarensis]